MNIKSYNTLPKLIKNLEEKQLRKTLCGRLSIRLKTILKYKFD